MRKKNLTAFEKALTDAALSRYQKDLEECRDPVQFSEEHKKKVQELKKKTTRSTWKYVNTVRKRLLVALIALLLLAATACAAIPALREGLIRFFTHDDGVAYSFEFSQEDIEKAPKEIETFYELGYVPDGYELFSKNTTPVISNLIYKNKEQDVFTFQQLALWKYEESNENTSGLATMVGITSERTRTERRVIYGYEVEIIYASAEDGTEALVSCWTDHSYFFIIKAQKLSFKEIEKTISGIIPR